MPFLKILSTLLCFLYFSSYADSNVNFISNKKLTDNVLSAISKINDSAINIEDHEKTATFIAKELLSTYTNPKEISKIGVLSYHIASGNANNSAYDAFFYQAFYASYMRLEELGSKESLNALLELRKKSQPQTGDKLVLDEIIKKLKKRLTNELSQSKSKLKSH